MWESLQDYEPAIRLSAFLGIFAIMALWEVAAPRRRLSLSRLARWPGNIGIVVFNTVVLRILFPTAAVGVALAAKDSGWGLFNILAAPEWLAMILSVVILDLAIYLQHVLVHFVPLLWRLHRMHHTDLDYDVTTGARFHPIEIIVSMGLKLMVVSAIGAPPLAVLVFEVILNATAMFNHGNVMIPGPVDRALRLFIVTPDMHRVHHSVNPVETNSNYGFSLSLWDRLFGTYRDQPEAGHEGMTLGFEQFRRPEDLRLDLMLIQPFLGPASGAPYASDGTGKGGGDD